MAHGARGVQRGAGRTHPIVAPYFHAGTTTKIDAPPKKGKTTLRNYFISCALHGHECVGYPAGDPTPVVTLTENPRRSSSKGCGRRGWMRATICTS